MYNFPPLRYLYLLGDKGTSQIFQYLLGTGEARPASTSLESVLKGKNQESKHFSRLFCHPKPVKHTFLFYAVQTKHNKNESFEEQSRAYHYAFMFVCLLSTKQFCLDKGVLYLF